MFARLQNLTLVPERASSRRRFRDGLILFLGSLAILQLLFLFRVLIPHAGLRALGGGDTFEYHELALSLLAGHGFSNQVFGLRPPTFPGFLALVYTLAGERIPIAVFYQVIFGALTTVMVYKLAYRLLRHHTASLIAGMLTAVEIGHIDTSVTMMSEPIHNFLLYLSLLFITDLLLRRKSWGAAAAGGVTMGLAFLARPITVYLPLAIALIMIIYQRRLWKHALVFLLVCAIPFTAWSYRNLYYADQFSMSSTTAYTLLFYKSVSVESHATHRDPEQVAIDTKLELERRLGHPVTRESIADYPVGRPEDLYTTDPVRQQVSMQFAMERLRKYPAWSVIMTGVSLVRLFDPSPAIPIPAWLQIAITGVELLLAALGLFVVGKQWRNRLLLMLGPLFVAYYAGLTALVLGGLYHPRYHTPFMPFLLIFAAVAIVAILRRGENPGNRRS